MRAACVWNVVSCGMSIKSVEQSGGLLRALRGLRTTGGWADDVI
jgi:hypothetical protein